MADPVKDEVLFQARLDAKLHDRFALQRERWGMSNKELLTRILESALLAWERSPGPPQTPAA